MKRQKGFTLIELLVVIAIIGLLATIALAALNSARKKSADAAVKSNMANIAAQAELYYDDTTATGGNGNYGPITITCTGGMLDNVNIKAMVDQAVASAGTTSPVKNCSTDTNKQKWAVLIGPLKGDTTSRNWCVDSSGNKGFTAVGSNTTNLGVCPSVTSS